MNASDKSYLLLIKGVPMTHEWQPAVIRNVHNLPNDSGLPDVHSDRIRPKYNPPAWFTAMRLGKGCNATQFYECESDNTVVCEHEILTD